MIDPRVDQTACAEFLKSRISELRSARAAKEAKWLDCFRAYNGDHDEMWVRRAKAEGGSHRFVNLTFDAVETISAQLSAMLFSHKDWLQVAPGRPGAILVDDHDAPIMQQMLYWQLEMMKFRPEFLNLVKALVICGNWSWALSWKIDWAVDYPHYYQAMQEWYAGTQRAWAEYQAVQQEWQAQSALALVSGSPVPPRPQIQMPQAPPLSLSKAYEGPEFIAESIFDYVQDPYANDPRSAFRAQAVWRTLAHLKKMARPNEQGYVVYENLDDIGEVDRGKGSTSNQDYQTALAQAFGHRMPSGKGIEIQECYGTMELPGTAIGGDTVGGNIIFPNYVAGLSHDGKLVRFEPVHTWSGDLPRQLATLIPIPGQIYGYGLIEPALDVQDYANYRANQIIDAVDYAMHPEMKAVDDGVIDPTEPTRPGFVHMVRSIGNLEPIIKPMTGIQIGMSDFALAKGEFQQITRAVNPFNNPNGGKTATEVARDSSITGSSIQEIARHIEEGTLLPIVQLALQYDQQYLPEGYYVRVGQGDLAEQQPISPEKVRMRWDIRLSGSSDLMARRESIQSAMQMLTIILGSPVAVPFADVSFLLRRIWSLQGHQDGDKVFPDQAAAMAVLNSWMQSATMQGLLVGGGGNGSGSGQVRGDGASEDGRGSGAAGQGAAGGLALPASGLPGLAALSPGRGNAGNGQAAGFGLAVPAGVR